MCRQSGNGAGNLSVPLLDDGNAAINRAGDGEVLIGNSPEYGGADGGLGLSFIEACHLAITVQDKCKAVAGAAVSKVMRNVSRTPQGSHVGMGDEQNFLRQIAD